MKMENKFKTNHIQACSSTWLAQNLALEGEHPTVLGYPQIFPAAIRMPNFSFMGQNWGFKIRDLQISHIRAVRTPKKFSPFPWGTLMG